MKRREHLTPDLTPLIDILFLLLIFFLATSVFKKSDFALNLTLPNAKYASKVKSEVKSVEILIAKDKIAISNKIISSNQLEEYLSKIKDKNLPIIAKIDKDVPYQKVAKLLDVCTKYSLVNIELIQDKK